MSQRTPYAYIRALVAAIEAWSGDAVRSDRSAFTHRGADLRRAVERCLYFALRDDAQLRSLFLAGGGDAKALAPYTRMIAPYLGVKIAKQNEDRPNGHPARLGDRLRRRLSGRMLPPVRAAETHRLAGQPDILFLVIDPRFVDFLAPVVKALNGQAAFLTIDDLATDAALAEENLPAVSVRSLSRRLQLGPGGALQPFANLCHYYDVLRAVMRARAPRAIVVAEGNVPACELANRAAHMASVPSLCIQYGWSPYSHNGFRHLDYDAMLVWGEHFAELLAPDNPRQRFVVTGTPLSFPAPAKTDGPVRGIGFFLQHVTQLGTEADWHQFLDLVGWCADAFPDVQIVVRPHPAMPSLNPSERASIGAHSNIRFMAPDEEALTDALALCDVVVSPFSTVLLEGIAVGAMPLIVASGLPQFWPDLPAMGAAIDAKTAAEARAALTRLVTDGSYRSQMRAAGAALRPKLFAASGDEAVGRIATEITRATAMRAAS